jgi:hypothetical protein
MDGILNLFVLIIVVGVVLWIINALIPMAPAFKTLLNVLALILVIVYILQFFGLIPNVLPPMQLFK